MYVGSFFLKKELCSVANSKYIKSWKIRNHVIRFAISISCSNRHKHETDLKIPNDVDPHSKTKKNKIKESGAAI